jgi:putative ABC transport system permease protein
MKILPFDYAARNLGRSLTRFALSVGGSTLVVLLVLVAGGFATGLQDALQVSGSSDNVILLGAGSEESIERSEVSMGTAGIVAGSVSGLLSRAGVEAVSPEVHLALPVSIGDEVGQLVVIRGIDDGAWIVHDEVRIAHGHGPRSGWNDLTAGRLAARAMGFDPAESMLGQEIVLDDDTYTVTGILEADGGVAEGEFWTALTDLQITAQRDSLSCIVVTLDTATPGSLAAFAVQRLDLQLVTMTEASYYDSLAAFYRPIQMMVIITCLLVAMGGVLGGLNSTYAAFASRVREVGTLQTLGYTRGAVMLSLVQESTLVSSIGALLACGIALVVLDGLAVQFSMGTFALSISAGVLAAGVGTGLFLGVIGAVVPSIRCLRLPIPDALRASE